MNIKNLGIIILLISLCSCGELFNKKDNTGAQSKINNSEVYEGRFALISSDKNALESYAKKIGAKFQVVDENDGVYELKEVPNNFTTKKIQEDLGSAVELVEPTYKLSIKNIPRDPFFMRQWGLANQGQNIVMGGIEGNYGSDIGALKAWEINKGSKDVVVAIIDTGIDYNHPDLKDNMWVNEKEKSGFKGIDDDGNGYIDDVYGYKFVDFEVSEPIGGVVGSPDPMDDNSHGTHCAGIVGATGNNGIGIVGVNWKVKLMAAKFLSGSGSGSTVDAYRAIKYAIKNKADVLSNSWGGGGASSLLKKVIQDAHDAGILFVAAAGNSTSDNDVEENYPSNYEVESLVAVAAIGNNDKLAYFSSFGAKKVHIAAPGLGILSTIPGNKYAVYSGTSMATPFVSGAAALLIANDPTFKGKPSLIKQRLMSTVDYIPELTTKLASAGRLNIFNMLTNKTSDIALGGSTKNWKVKDISVKTPSANTEVIRFLTKVQEPGALKIKLYIESSVVDGYDSAFISNGKYQKVMMLGSEVGGIWTPEIDGDTAYVFFNNSKLQDFDFWTDEPTGPPYINYNSDGIVISKIAYKTK